MSERRCRNWLVLSCFSEPVQAGRIVIQSLPELASRLQRLRDGTLVARPVLFFEPTCRKHSGVSENIVPLNPIVLLIIIPIKWLFHWEYTLFSDTPIHWFIGDSFMFSFCGLNSDTFPRSHSWPELQFPIELRWPNLTSSLFTSPLFLVRSYFLLVKSQRLSENLRKLLIRFQVLLLKSPSSFEELLLPLRAKVLLHREGFEHGHPRRGAAESGGSMVKKPDFLSQTLGFSEGFFVTNHLRVGAWWFLRWPSCKWHQKEHTWNHNFPPPNHWRV